MKAGGRRSLAALLALAGGWAAAAGPAEDALDLDLAQLGQIEISRGATITPTASRRVPASVTVIDRAMIRDAAARSLFDLLETYVPNLHYLPHHWEAPHLGLRGIIGDRDDKLLIVLNGRVLNEQTHYGAMSERDLPLLDDIARIDVVRGPGSVVFGPGAVSMVISIQTESATDATRDGITLKLGGVERFASLEAKKTLRFSDRHALLLYAGIADSDGAHNDSAPMVYGNTFQTTWGQTVHAGEPAPFTIPDHHSAFRGKPRIKLHADYSLGDWRAWLRYTQGGEEMTWEHKIFGTAPVGFGAPGTPQSGFPVQGAGYRQLVLDVSRRWALDGGLAFELKAGWDSFAFERRVTRIAPPWEPVENHREDHALLRGTLHGALGASQTFALGAEYVHSRFGLASPGYGAAYSAALGRDTAEWTSGAWALFGEHQWQLSDTLTQFLGLRADKDQFTRTMWSPRWSLVWAPNERDTFKSVLSRSVRKNNAEELYRQQRGGQTSEPEILQGVEFIYQRLLSPVLRLDTALIYNEVQVIGIDSTSLRSTRVADFSTVGLEVELSYKTPTLRLSASHGCTHLLDFAVAPGVVTRLSSAHLGYTRSLNNWSDQITKLSAAWQASEDWRLSGALRVFWGYPGAEGVTRSINDSFKPGSPATSMLSDPGYTESFGPAAFLDLGVEYRISEAASARLQGYNILGVFDRTLNKRPYLLNGSNYRADAAALAVEYRHAF